ncbi:MAG: hypothetical protein M3530_06000 [Thermoproteota archaeon]|nr:hypothetical protein [Thermoproteota archaeon]
MSVFLTLLIVGISNTIGNQFFSAYSQTNDGSGDGKEQSDLTSIDVNNQTITELGNMTNATSTGLTINELPSVEENTTVDNSGAISDQGISEPIEGQESEVPAQQNTQQETSDTDTGSQGQLGEQQNLGEQNSSESATNMNMTRELQSSNVTQPPQNVTNATSTEEQDQQQHDQQPGPEAAQSPDLQPLAPEQNATNVTATETSGAPQSLPLIPQQNATNIGTGRNNVTNVTSTLGTPQVDLLSANTTQDQPLAPETEFTENDTGGTTTTSSSNASAVGESNLDALGQITPPEEILGNQTSEEIDAATSGIAGISNVTSTIENNQISNIQNVINTIALSSGQSGGNAQRAASEIAKEIVSDPKGPVAKAIQTLAGEYSKGNSDEVAIAAKQIGTLIAKGNNIQQTLVQVTNNVVNNIPTIKTSIENYDKIVVHPKTSSKDKTVIEQTINVIKNSKKEVDVPQVHIKFHNHERNLVLRVLSTNNYKYDMPFSKYNGAFILDDNEFRVKIVSGDGISQSASVAKMFKSGKVGDRVFLDKDVRKGRVYFSLDDIDNGKYLLEVYVKLSNGSIGTFARGSVSIR